MANPINFINFGGTMNFVNKDNTGNYLMTLSKHEDN